WSPGGASASAYTPQTASAPPMTRTYYMQPSTFLLPDLLGVLETSLYVDAFERACPFYERVLGLNSIYRDARLCAYDVGARGVLLVFLRGSLHEPSDLSGCTVPPHDGHGPIHIAFSVGADARADWEARL